MKAITAALLVALVGSTGCVGQAFTTGEVLALEKLPAGGDSGAADTMTDGGVTSTNEASPTPDDRDAGVTLVSDAPAAIVTSEAGSIDAGMSLDAPSDAPMGTVCSEAAQCAPCTIGMPTCSAQGVCECCYEGICQP